MYLTTYPYLPREDGQVSCHLKEVDTLATTRNAEDMNINDVVDSINADDERENKMHHRVDNQNVCIALTIDGYRKLVDRTNRRLKKMAKHLYPHKEHLAVICVHRSLTDLTWQRDHYGFTLCASGNVVEYQPNRSKK